ncbi:discoidin domain-containing protein [Nocardia sp. NPDC058058]|uniref:discoidin domain-containing protein n=1 Tax=Nocardia sp. NPDC058058 TaxID=3346317 RepID=UPI0036DDAA6C
MPDTDPADIFLQHREAVLEALLSDPSLGWAGPPAADPLSGLDDDHPFAPEAFPDAAVNSGSGPKASERILALLNGESANSGFDWPDYAPPPPAGNLAPAPSAEENTEPSASSRASDPGAARFASPIRDLVLRARKPKVALAIGGALLLVVVVAILTSGGSPDSAGNRTVIATATGPVNPAGPTPSTSTTPTAGSAIQIKSAQSHCPPGGTPAMDAFVGTGKAWSCPRAYRVDGQVLIIDLGRSYRVDSIGMVPGWDSIGSDGADQWAKYRTASRISYKFDDANATTYTQQTLDQRALVVTKVNPEISTTKIVVTVLESKGDPAINSIALSSMVVTGH